MTLAWHVALPHADKIVLLALADNANDEGYCFPSSSTLARKCGMDERSIRRVVDRLVSSGHVTRHERPGRSCTFDVHPGPSVPPDYESPRTESPDTPDRPSPTPDRGSENPGPSVPHNRKRTVKEPSGNRREARRARAPSAQRLPADFELTDQRRDVAKREAVDAEREFARFTDYWRAASGANARKHDWDAAWRNWCRKAQDMRRGTPAAAREEEPKLKWRPPDDDGNPDHARRR